MQTRQARWWKIKGLPHPNTRKNLLDKFNPAARSLITAGKAYLKALHGAMSASKIYLETLTKVARHSQQGLWGGSSDIGMCLMQMVDVYKEVQAQQMNILKAFYVDLLVPLETNLDKDTKVLQSEQKKFLSSHKHQLDSYTKAASQVKKHKKKNRGNKGTMDKEIKQYQALEEEKLKMDAFVESSLQNAVTQERRRYGFILERQCSLAKHYLAYHAKGSNLLQHTLDNWQDVAKTRETLPDRIRSMLPSARPKDEGIYSTPMCLEDDAMSVTSQMRKARSVDASCLDLSNIADDIPSRPLTRARSEFNLDHRFTPEHMMLRRSMAIPEDLGRRAMARALYSYSPSGDNQLSFGEMDLIGLIGEKNKGWQYGENLRTQRCGWFPVAYTEIIHEEDDSALGSMSTQHLKSRNSVDDSQTSNPTAGSSDGHSGDVSQPPHVHTHRYPSKHRSASAHAVQFRAPSPATASNASTSTSSTALPMSQPSTSSTASSKSSHVASSHETLRTSTSVSSSVNTVLFNHAFMEPQPPRVSAPTLKKSPSQPQTYSRPGSNSFTSSSSLTPGSSMTLSRSFTTAAASSHLSTRFQKRGSGNSSSFHSSDDSGFSNESGSMRPPVNPDADYSDDDLNGVAPHSMNSLSSRWLRSALALPYGSDPVSLPCLPNSESYSSSEARSLQYIPPLQDATVTLPTPGRKSKTLKGKPYRDRSLPSFSIDHFVTIARRKTTKVSPNSPCAQKIAAQRERGRQQDRGRRTLRRSSSLLCLGMDSCTGIPDDLQSADYEDVWSEDWRHSSLVDLHTDIPDPPPFQPPPPPTSFLKQPIVDYSIRPPMPIPQGEQQQSPVSSTQIIPNEMSPQNSSSGNSTLTGSDEEDEEEIYMVVSDHRRELRKTITRAQSRKQLARSLTWASPAQRSSSSPPKLPPKGEDKSSRSTISFKINRFRQSRNPHVNTEQSCQQSTDVLKTPQPSYLAHPSNPPIISYDSITSPPLPPKKNSSRPQHPLPQNLRHEDYHQPQYHHRSSNPWQYGGSLNIFNYSDFMNRRLKCPEGVSRLDQVSFTTGNLCGPWYDLWADDPSVADV
ncbi:serine-rich adhesin for platelets-like isoform X2 [Homarus americanus]|nr:serine-rich adhesin for platelets-like isoform X2 [Homarus americanus]